MTRGKKELILSAIEGILFYLVSGLTLNFRNKDRLPGIIFVYS